MKSFRYVDTFILLLLLVVVVVVGKVISFQKKCLEAAANPIQFSKF